MTGDSGSCLRATVKIRGLAGVHLVPLYPNFYIDLIYSGSAKPSRYRSITLSHCLHNQQDHTLRSHFQSLLHPRLHHFGSLQDLEKLSLNSFGAERYGGMLTYKGVG
jgi:hypothetical protein